MATQDESRICARDRRLAAVHEAGHLVVAHHFGLIIASAQIFPTDATSDFEKIWVGNFSLSRLMLVGKRNPRIKQARPSVLRAVAVAGAVAEFCWQRLPANEIIEQDRWEDAHVMSPKDWAMAGHGQASRHVTYSAPSIAHFTYWIGTEEGCFLAL